MLRERLPDLFLLRYLVPFGFNFHMWYLGLQVSNMVDPRLVQIPANEQVFATKWFQLLEERSKQQKYWTFSSSALSLLAFALYLLYYSMEMPIGYYLAATWLLFSGSLSWYLNRNDRRVKSWKQLAGEGGSFSFSQAKMQLTHDRLPLRHSLFYGAVIGIALFLLYQGAKIVENDWFPETWLMIILSLALGQASGFLQRYLYNTGIEADLKAISEIEAAKQTQHD
jgi:hypothetical protein